MSEPQVLPDDVYNRELVGRVHPPANCPGIRRPRSEPFCSRSQQTPMFGAWGISIEQIFRAAEKLP